MSDSIEDLFLGKVSKKSKKKSPESSNNSYIDTLIDRDVWEEVVPIVTDDSGKVHSVYINGGIEEPIEYSKLCHFIDMVPKGHTIRFNINTPGGSADSCFDIHNRLINCKAKTIGVLSGTVASAGTVIALACDDLEVTPYLSWLSHNYSSGMSGKGSELKAQAEFMSNELASAFTAIHKHFFTSKEIKEIVNDKDYWLGSAEVKRRFKLVKKGRKGGKNVK